MMSAFQRGPGGTLSDKETRKRGDMNIERKRCGTLNSEIRRRGNR